MMRSVGAIAALLVATVFLPRADRFAAAQAAQSAGGQSGPALRASVDLVTIDVRVLDRQGRPVRGLTAGDFTVTLGGTPVPVRVLDALEFGGTAAARSLAPADPAVAPPVSASPATVPRSILIAIDELSFRPAQATAFVDAARRLLDNISADDLVGVVTTANESPVRVGTDRTVARSALDLMVGRQRDRGEDGRVFNRGPDLNEAAEEDARLSLVEARAIDNGNDAVFGEVIWRFCRELFSLRADTTPPPCPAAVISTARKLVVDLDAEISFHAARLERLVEISAAMPTPRLLVLATNGMGLSADRQREIERVAARARNAGVHVAMLTQTTSVALMNAEDRTHRAQDVRRVNQEVYYQGAELLAGMFNADFARVTITADAAIDRLLTEWSAMYRLAVDPPAGGADLERLTPRVTVNRTGTQVRASRGFMPTGTAVSATPDAPRPASPPPATVEERLLGAVRSGSPMTGVAIALGTAGKRDESGGEMQIVTVRVTANTAPPLTAVFGIVAESGEMLRSGAVPLQRANADDDYLASFGMPVPPGRYRTRVAVADGAGNLGAIDRELIAGLRPAGPGHVSDWLIAWADEASHYLSIEDVPAPARLVHATVEWYPNAGETGGVQMRASLARAGSSVPIDEWIPAASPLGTASQFVVELPWSALDPGEYVLRAEIGPLGSQPTILSRTLRKPAGK